MTRSDKKLDMIGKSWLFIFSLLFLCACSHIKLSGYKPQVSHNLGSSEALPSPLILDAGKFLPELNSAVEKWIQYFSVKDRERFQRFLNRGEKYRNIVQSVLKENDIPPEMYYLAMIESGYVTHARSHASAVGVWQFIKSTGIKYDLEINHYVDERKDLIRATEAASKYLRDLYTAFQSWELAMAAYNSGEYGVLSNIIKGKTRNYWELRSKKLLPRETRNYVPKFLAAAIIGSNPHLYGFILDDKQEDAFLDVYSVEIPAPVKLSSIAKITNISLQTLQKLNPHIYRGITSPTGKTYEIWIPDEKRFIVQELIPQIAELRIKRLRGRQYAASRKEKYYHHVRRGDNLSTLAHKYRVSITHLKRLNNLKGDKLYINQRLRLIAKSYHSTIDKKYYHRVRRGENLSMLARKYRIPISSLKRLNRIKRDKIYVGQRLRIRSKKHNKSKHYVVRRGDSLYSISKKKKISIRKIKNLNKLSSNRIFPGMRLEI